MDSKLVLVVYKQPPSHFLHCCQLGDPKYLQLYRAFWINLGLKLAYIIGYCFMHSLSAFMHNYFVVVVW